MELCDDLFPSTLFLGKKAFFKEECCSTNDELLEIIKKDRCLEGTIFFTDYQTKGRGQRGNFWISERGKNVLLSILLRQIQHPNQQFILNMLIGIVLLKSLQKYLLPMFSIKLKWPNDVYVNRKKIAGILIENALLGNRIASSVVGIGINLNQENLRGYNATSLKLLLKKEVDRMGFTEKMLIFLEQYLKTLKSDPLKVLKEYNQKLFCRGEKIRYEDRRGISFEGKILGVNNFGKLEIENTQGIRTLSYNEVRVFY